MSFNQSHIVALTFEDWQELIGDVRLCLSEADYKLRPGIILNVEFIQSRADFFVFFLDFSGKIDAWCVLVNSNYDSAYFTRTL